MDGEVSGQSIHSGANIPACRSPPPRQPLAPPPPHRHGATWIKRSGQRRWGRNGRSGSSTTCCGAALSSRGRCWLRRSRSARPVSIFQVTTQLQEVTLSYVPKILAAAAVLIATGPWMLGRVTDFATALYAIIPAAAG
ncbi:flagellar biosynthetic protein FliQ [Sphingomonas sp. MMS24-JH45]